MKCILQSQVQFAISHTVFPWNLFNMQVTPSIFKAYDIRGIVPSTINEDMAEALGKAFGTLAMAEG